MVSGLFVFLHFAPGSEVHRENFRSSGIFVPGNWERKVQELSLLVISVGDANKSSKIPKWREIWDPGPEQHQELT